MSFTFNESITSPRSPLSPSQFDRSSSEVSVWRIALRTKALEYKRSGHRLRERCSRSDSRPASSNSEHVCKDCRPFWKTRFRTTAIMRVLRLRYRFFARCVLEKLEQNKNSEPDFEFSCFLENLIDDSEARETYSLYLNLKLKNGLDFFQ